MRADVAIITAEECVHLWIMQASRLLHSAIASGVSPPLATLTLPAREFLDEDIKDESRSNPEEEEMHVPAFSMVLHWYAQL